MKKKTFLIDIDNTICKTVGNNYKNSKGVILFVQHQSVIPMLDMSQDWSNPEKVMDEFKLNDKERAEIYDYYKKHFK